MRRYIGFVITYASIGIGILTGLFRVFVLKEFEGNTGIVFFAVLLAFLGLIIQVALNEDDYKMPPPKRRRGFDKEQFERYQQYKIATKKRR